jgi:hypothetical protein
MTLDTVITQVATSTDITRSLDVACQKHKHNSCSYHWYFCHHFMNLLISFAEQKSAPLILPENDYFSLFKAHFSILFTPNISAHHRP